MGRLLGWPVLICIRSRRWRISGRRGDLHAFTRRDPRLLAISLLPDEMELVFLALGFSSPCFWLIRSWETSATEQGQFQVAEHRRHSFPYGGSLGRFGRAHDREMEEWLLVVRRSDRATRVHFIARILLGQRRFCAIGITREQRRNVREIVASAKPASHPGLNIFAHKR